jgi:hydrophobic/amphiphilic exporter-1 (mainly G- bacteria), HAE1 family
MRDLPRDIDPPTIAKADTDQSPSCLWPLRGRPQRELTEIADKIVKTHIERSPVWARWTSLADWSGPSMSGSMPTAWPLTGSPSRRSANAVERQNANIPGGNVTGRNCASNLAHDGPADRPAAFNDLVIATRNGIADPRPGHRLGGGWHQGAAVDIALNGLPSVTLEVMRQSGANTVNVIEGVKEGLAELEPSCRSDVKVEVSGTSPVTFTRRCTKSTAPGPGQHPGLRGCAAVHAQLARHGHRRGGHSHLGHCRFRHDEGAWTSP